MRWPWSRRPRKGDESPQAVNEASAQLQAAEDRWDIVRPVAAELRRARQENHFVDLFPELGGGTNRR